MATIRRDSDDVFDHADHTIDVTQVEAHRYSIEVVVDNEGHHLYYGDGDLLKDMDIRALADHGEVWCRTCDVQLDATATYAA